MECINVYQIKSTNKMIEEETSKPLSPFDFTYRSKHNPVGVNRNFKFDFKYQVEESHDRK